MSRAFGTGRSANFTSEHLREHHENQAIPMELSNVNLTENLRNHNRIFRRDRELGRIPIGSLSTRVFETRTAN